MVDFTHEVGMEIHELVIEMKLSEFGDGNIFGSAEMLIDQHLDLSLALRLGEDFRLLRAHKTLDFLGES